MPRLFKICMCKCCIFNFINKFLRAIDFVARIKKVRVKAQVQNFDLTQK